MTVSRTGYTGDLGFEVTVPRDQALDVLDAILEAGSAYGLRPFGEDALMMLRIEAGLPLIDIDFQNSRLVFTDHDRVTPQELGLGWMLKGVLDGDRPFIGRDAIVEELQERHVALVDGGHRRRLAGLGPALPRRRAAPEKDENPLDWESMLYDAEGGHIGYATAFMYSPVLQRHIGMARVRPELRRARQRGAPRDDHQPPQHHRAGADRQDAPLQPRAEDVHPMSEHATSTTRSSSAAATTAWSTAPTSPRPACGP